MRPLNVLSVTRYNITREYYIAKSNISPPVLKSTRTEERQKGCREISVVPGIVVPKCVNPCNRKEVKNEKKEKQNVANATQTAD